MEAVKSTDWNAGFFQPAELDEALAIRERYASGVLPVMGATLVGRALNANEIEEARILDLTRVKGFKAINIQHDRVEIAAGVSFRHLESIYSLGALATAARGVGGPAIRNRATLGGNLVSARNDGDGCVAALALPTQVELRSAASGVRRIGIDDFFGAEQGMTAVRSNELLTCIIVPTNVRSAWSEVGIRVGASHSLVCCAASVSQNGATRIALGGVARSVCRARKAEQIIATAGLDNQAIGAAVSALRTEIAPETDWRASGDYRREMAVVMAKRALLALQTAITSDA